MVKNVLMPPKPQTPVAHWLVAPGLTDYAMAVSEMQQRARAIRQATAPEVVWLVEHPPLYTAGTSAQTRDLIEPNRFPVHQTGRGGQYTY
ncbi:MAG: lipoyl(octanoyl) transferase LipB, partial [Hyphomicrobiales bacterium]